MVERDLDNVVEFYERFESEVLNEVATLAELLETAAVNIEDILMGTNFATKSSEDVKIIAIKLKEIVDTGSAKIKVLKKTAEAHVEREKRFR